MYSLPVYCSRVGSYRKMILQRRMKRGAEVVKKLKEGRRNGRRARRREE